MKEVKNIFIVDDEKTQSTMMKDYLSKYSYLNIHTFNSGEEALNQLNTLQPQIVFLDYDFHIAGRDAMNGLEILKEIKEKRPDTEVIMVSGQDKIDVAVNTMKYGAFDYVVKSESAFHRSENAIFNIIRRMKLQGEAKLYKNLTIALGIALAAAVVISIVLYKTGHVSDNPGWF